MHHFKKWIGQHKACTTWFHAAHHVTKGTGFLGDHVNLYGKIYTDLEDDFDGLVEKALGMTNEESLACPAAILSDASMCLSIMPIPSSQCSLGIASNALAIIKEYIKMLDMFYKQFESEGTLTLGLDDMICAMSNKYESYVYLLQQRVKVEVG